MIHMLPMLGCVIVVSFWGEHKAPLTLVSGNEKVKAHQPRMMQQPKDCNTMCTFLSPCNRKVAIR